MDKFFSFLETVAIGLFKLFCTIIICSTLLVIVLSWIS